MPLNLDYRPDSFEEFFGNETTIKALIKALDKGKQSFFITGRPGSGKTTLGRIIGNYLGVGKYDFHEYDTANTRGIAFVRDIIDSLMISPQEGTHKLYLMDENHMLTREATNSLLKSYEKPPGNTIIVLCTAEPDAIEPTLLDALKRRGFYVDLKPLIKPQMVEFIQMIVGAEEATVTPKVIERIAELSEGSPGIALGILEPVMYVDTEEEALEMADTIRVNEFSVTEIARILLFAEESNVAKWNKVKVLLRGVKGNPEQLRRALCTYIQKVITSNNEKKHHQDVGSCFAGVYFTNILDIVLACRMACFVTEDIPF